MTPTLVYHQKRAGGKEAVCHTLTPAGAWAQETFGGCGSWREKNGSLRLWSRCIANN